MKSDRPHDHPRAECLADLPRHRRLAVALAIINFDGDGARVFGANCVFQPPTVPIADGAVAGDDGRYHLSRAGELACQSSMGIRGSRHVSWLGWWTDGERYRLQVPAGADYDDYTSFKFAWRVQTLDGELIDPASVPTTHRCPLDREHWPGYIGGTSVVAEVRRALVEALGPACSLCHERFPFAIDHDHDTGLVRGYLCRDCNTRVERCVHVDDCPRAEYLNDPPAAWLGLVHPKRVERRRRADRASTLEAAMRLVDEAGR